MTQPADRPFAEPFIEIALRWDLRQLHREVAAALSTIEAAGQPYVPTQLARSLHMFLDSYDPDGASPAER